VCGSKGDIMPVLYAVGEAPASARRHARYRSLEGTVRGGCLSRENAGLAARSGRSKKLGAAGFIGDGRDAR